MSDAISEITRRAILDFLSTSNVSWSGRLEETEFLSRLYNLSELPSTDRRVRDAWADIQMHRVTWQDWEDDWVLHDERFNLLRGSDENFLRFLCETIHPVVRADAAAARELCATYNGELQNDGFKLVETSQISGRPVFTPEGLGQRAQVFDEPTGWQKVDRQLQQARLQLETAKTEEQWQAVGLLCREVLITVAQEVFDSRRHPTEDGVAPSSTDAKRMLDAVLLAELPGAANSEARAHARAAVQLALALQHKRTATFKMAALCAEAASSTVNILAVLFERRRAST